MSGPWREQVSPCFCGKGRITESWYNGQWSEILLQCAACDRIYEYKVVERAQDGSERTAWVKREAELPPESHDGRSNPIINGHDYTGQPVHQNLFGSQFAEDSAGHMFSQPVLSDLKHFDTVGFLYVMQSDSIPEFLKVGITTRPLNKRAQEHTKDFILCQPFQVLAAWQMRNFRLVEYFLMRRLLHLRSNYVKGRRYFRDVRERKLCVRTHRSAELYKSSFEEAYSQISLVLNKTPELVEFEQWFLDWLTKQLSVFRQQATGGKEYVRFWQRALDTMRQRLNAGETSICVVDRVIRQ
jgi:hypothetical protein